MEIKTKTTKIRSKAEMPHREDGATKGKVSDETQTQQLSNGTTKEKMCNENQREQESCREKMGNTKKPVGLKPTDYLHFFIFFLSFRLI